MHVRSATALFVLLTGPGFAQTVTTLNLSTQGHNPDFASFPFTRPISTGSAIPATCQMGQMFFNTAAAAGQNIYACTQTNTWTLLGAYTLLPAGPNTLGGVFVANNAGLNVDGNGVLSANLGTSPGTLAAGNDSRIVNALQPTSQIPASNVTGLARSATTDTTNASNIATGILAASLLPSTINSSTSGNAATASSLNAIPSACAVNQYALGILANGTARCAQVAYGQVSGAPTLYNQGLQVAGRAQTQRTNLNFAAGSNVTITPSDNGSNTTTLTISGTGASGLPDPGSNGLVKRTAANTDVVALAGTDYYAPGTPISNADLPRSITSSITGNAATATAFAANPGVCPGGQFATGIGPNGNAVCGTPTGTGGLPDPGSNGLVKRTAANADVAATAGADYYAPGTPISDADLPSTITSSITGNAATASALAAAPTGCAGGQFIEQIGANGNPVACGVAASGGPNVTSGSGAPTASSCSVSTFPSIYVKTGQVSQTNPHIYMCELIGSSYRWMPMDGHTLNAMDFGCAADGSTDDQGCIQSAINLAKVLNKFTNFDSGNAYMGSDIYLPCGDYAIGSPIVLPRSNPASFSHGPSNGVVSLIGESANCVVIQTTSSLSGFQGVSGVFVTNQGSGYTSNPSVSFSGGCSTEPIASSLLQPGNNTVADVYITTAGSGCTSMPSCTISGGSGSGATCETLGRALIEWAPVPVGTFMRTVGEHIMNMRLKPPALAGAMSIHFQINNTPNDSSCAIGGGTVCERQEQADFENLYFASNNSYNPADIMWGGDCNTCIFKNIGNDPPLGTQTYQTVLLATNYWASAVSNEGDGIQYGLLENFACGDSKNGSAPCFQGRLQRATFRTAFCDGINITPAMAACYAFLNSSNVILENLGNEGNGGYQFYISNSRNFNGTNLGIGTPVTVNSQAPLGGLYLVGTSNSKFDGVLVASSVNWFTGFGVYRVSTDSSSFQNQFLDWQLVGTNEINLSQPGNNFMQYCAFGACDTNVNWSTLGTKPY